MIAPAGRPSWRRAHIERQEREAEARLRAKECREAERAGLRQCRSCGEFLPLDRFYLFKQPRSPCKGCSAPPVRPVEDAAVGVEDAAAPPAIEVPAAVPASGPRKRGPYRVSPKRLAQRQRKAAERASYLAALLNGRAPGERINDAETWNSAMAELHKLWHLSGDKHCVSCKATVPAGAMLPPGPGNFYPGQCQPCARASFEANRRAALGIPAGEPLPGPRLIPLRDGTRITLAELARRCRTRAPIRHGLLPVAF